MQLFVAKARRVFRNLLPEWWTCFCKPFHNAEAIFGVLSWACATFLIFRFRAEGEVMPLVADIVFTFFAIALAAVLWGVFTLCYAPFAVVQRDRKLGQWNKNHFTFLQDELVFLTKIGNEDGKTQRFQILFSSAEPNSLVSLRFDVGNYNPGSFDILIDVRGEEPDSDIRLHPPRHPGMLPTQGYEPSVKLSVRLPKSRKATLYIRLAQNQAPRTVRVYCTEFAIGKKSEFEM